MERHNCLKGNVIDSCCAGYILCRWIVILCCLHIMMSCTSSILCRWVVILCCHHAMMSCACSILCRWVVILCCHHDVLCALYIVLLWNNVVLNAQNRLDFGTQSLRQCSIFVLNHFAFALALWRDRPSHFSVSFLKGTPSHFKWRVRPSLFSANHRTLAYPSHFGVLHIC